MSYLIDTNVLSELRRQRPDDRVSAWFANRPASSLYLSVLTLGEIRKGVESITDVKRRTALIDWLEVELPAFFAGRLLPVDVPVADSWGRMLASAKRPMPAIDSLLAATASHHHLTLVTRNVKDFADWDLALINPWDE